MTHYEKRYDDSEQALNDRHALIDTIEYLGRAKYKDLVKCAILDYKNTQPHKKKGFHQYLRFALSIGGVQGYPVEAFARRYLGIKKLDPPAPVKFVDSKGKEVPHDT